MTTITTQQQLSYSLMYSLTYMPTPNICHDYQPANTIVLVTNHEATVPRLCVSNVC